MSKNFSMMPMSITSCPFLQWETLSGRYYRIPHVDPVRAKAETAADFPSVFHEITYVATTTGAFDSLQVARRCEAIIYHLRRLSPKTNKSTSNIYVQFGKYHRIAALC
ncbi:hypothetical protein GGS23DRAFT_595334 [Durotheca rogersii]|uniref:uncharacterized protein n=1 Tax=Durotheca rogersii TaxID=419775 RepID=UPI00221E637C|nr:uncharacterized protein GGS23DRAFT_595334 [Durotheca rogersii]KAI5864615.1 hypothetical protein GGS23DRAFT_595334 [Durotheca rogersii]